MAAVDKLFHYIVRVPKDESAFLYFTLEANEGICFYSTLDHEKGQTYRDIDIKGHVSLEAEMKKVLHSLQGQLNLEVLMFKPEI